ncbi:MAG: MFS transporter [Elusimicrobiota bacterium]
MTKNIYLAFFVLFAIAGVCRFISGYFVSKMDDIPPVIVPEKAFNYWDFLKRFPKGNFIRFTFFVSGINFATYIASPFFTVYMFKELHFTYAVYTLIVTLSTLIGLLIVPSWGKLADKVGNVKILQICAVFLPVIPVLWCFSGNPYYLFIVNIFAVHLLNGFNLSTFNFIFDAASPAVRTRCIGYFSFTNGLLIGLACLLGGFIVIYVPAFMNASKILSVFYISGLLGAIVNIFGINSLKEVRHSNKIEDSKLILTVLGITPVLELSNEILGLRFHRLKEK